MSIKNEKKYDTVADTGTVTAEKSFTVPLFQEELLSLDDGREQEICYLVTSGDFGSGNKTFGGELMQKFFRSLVRQSLVPAYILFINEGVYLTLENSPLFEEISALEKEGTCVLSSEESLAFYCPQEKIALGRKANMNNIVMILHTVDKVITL